MNYPYYVAVIRSGRLETPLQYRHTPIDRMFKTGKIGGTKNREISSEDPMEIQVRALAEERSGKTVEIYYVANPNRPRRACPSWRDRKWNGVQ